MKDLVIVSLILAMFGFIITAIVGWALNIVTLFTAVELWGGEFFVRLIGVPVVVIGAILGYL